MAPRALLFGFIVSVSAAIAGPAWAGPALISAEPLPPSTETYAQHVQAAESMYRQEVEQAKREGKVHTTPFTPVPEETFNALRDPAVLEVLRITYLSDGLRVKGFIWKPKDTAGRKLPVIILNRGGNRETGKLHGWSNFPLRYAHSGFVVIGSQYRGNDGGEGAEQFGGDDVNDILNLRNVIAELGYADPDNVFMVGWSRGGMMTYAALRRGMKVNAAAIGGPLLNLVEEVRRRPALEKHVLAQVVPSFMENREIALRDRSPIFWAEEIETPMLLLHGGADWRVDPVNTLELARKLQTAGREYELVVFAGDDHGITRNQARQLDTTVEWFRRHMKR
jgi:dipeptidyl aminopeptidase/acylaminoacyl peptidase